MKTAGTLTYRNQRGFAIFIPSGKTACEVSRRLTAVFRIGLSAWASTAKMAKMAAGLVERDGD